MGKERKRREVEQMISLEREKAEIFDARGVLSLERLEGRFDVKGLTFHSGNEGNPLLRDMHLSLKEGEKIVIVGRTGCGKTVFCNLLARALEPPEVVSSSMGLKFTRYPWKR
jgi:ATP-binding cassette subfamily B protein